jgi:acetolactate synthase-1/2/3 large subunit
MGLGAPSSAAKAMLHIGAPDLDWRALAKGHGIESARVNDLQTFAAELGRGFASPGPYLIEVMI